MTESSIQVLYFSWIRETIGSDEEIVALAPTVHTVGDLLAKLCRRGANYQRAFSDPGRVRAAVNQTHVTLDHPVSAGDEVAFFPPVTGG